MKFFSHFGREGDASLHIAKEEVAQVLPCEKRSMVEVVGEKVEKEMKENNKIKRDEEVFLFNPDASEFVPSNKDCVNDSSSLESPNRNSVNWRKEKDTEVHFKGGNESLVTDASLKSTSTITDSYSSSGTNSKLSDDYPSEGPSVHNFKSFSDPSYDYFPQPPTSCLQSQGINYQPVNNFDEYSYNSFVVKGANDAQESLVQAQPVAPFVPAGCTPVYGFVGFTMPQATTETHVLVKLPITSAGLPSFVPATPVQQIQSIHQQQQHQIQQTSPLSAIPAMSLPQFPPRVTIPTAVQQPGYCVTIFVPNLPSSSQIQKTCPDFTPANAQRNPSHWAPPHNIRNERVNYY